MRPAVVFLVSLALLQAGFPLAPAGNHDPATPRELSFVALPVVPGSGIALRSASSWEPISREAGMCVLLHFDPADNCGYLAVDQLDSGGQRPGLSLQLQNVRLQI